MRLREAFAPDTLFKMALSPESIRHVRPAQPLRFPSSQPEWDVGQSIRHLHLCTILHEILLSVLGPASSVGCDQFVYFDAANPRRCLAPDGFVKLGVPQEMFESWKVWEKGAPELAIEVLSPSDTREPISLQEKIDRYSSIGVRELVVLDVDAPEGTRLRAWDRLDGELVERIVESERTPCVTLEMWFVLAPANDQPIALRVARDPAGADLVLTEREAKLNEREAKEQEREAKERERDARERERDAREREREAKEAALAEVAKLRAELARGC